MEFLKGQWSRIQQQLSGLNSTQRMLAGALVVIMAMTLYWWGNYASQAEMEPLFDQALEPEQAKAIIMRLKAAGIPYRTLNDRIHVPTDRHMEAWADLSWAQALPHDTKTAFDDMIKTSNPFISNREAEAKWNEYRQAKLSQIIRSWPSVKHAAVIIDPRRERGPNGVEPTATVNITLRDGQTIKQNPRLVDTAADFLSGAVANLSRGRVTVVVNGASHIVRDRNDPLYGFGDDLPSRVEQQERRYAEKLTQQFSYIEGVLASVSVKINTERKEMTIHSVDTKNKLQMAVVEENNTANSQSSQKPSGEAGVASNAGMSLGETAAGETTNEETEKNRTEYRVDAGTQDIRTYRPPGDCTPVSATLLVPRNYFARAYKVKKGTDADPQMLDDFIQREAVDMRKSAKACLGLESEEAIVVNAYLDPAPAASVAGPQAAGPVLSLALGDHAKEIALGVLALLSLFMVSSMVKKGSAAPPVPVAPAPKPAPPLGTAEEAVGEAGDGDPLLDGMELDEDSVKAQQMISQVSQMVEENPDAAASLVKRWLSRS